jgi:hypothetical protein
LRAALSTVSAVPSGYAVTLYTHLRTGRLAAAFLLMERLGSQRWAHNTPFWAAMCKAAEILVPDHNDLAEVHLRCRKRANP